MGLAAKLVVGALVAVVAGSPATADDGGRPRARRLRIYWIDTSASTLIVTPHGKMILIDAGEEDQATGHGGGTSADRIFAVIAHVVNRDSRQVTLDHLIVSHWHVDHAGGALNLPGTFRPVDYPNTTSTHVVSQAGHVVARHVYDRGRSNIATGDAARETKFDTIYQGSRTTATVGMTFTEDGVSVKVVAVNGAVGDKKPAFNCALATEIPEGQTVPVNAEENCRSVAVVVSYGGVRYLDTGDLVDEPLHRVVEKVGHVTAYRTSWHGASVNTADVFKALRPRAVISNSPCGSHVADDLRVAMKKAKLVKDLLWELNGYDGEVAPHIASPSNQGVCEGDDEVGYVVLSTNGAEARTTVAVGRTPLRVGAVSP